MKKVCIVLIAVLLAFSSSMAFADTKVTLGLKSWYNWWTHDRDYASGTTKSWDNGSSFMVGPSLNIKAGKVFFGGSYLQSTSNYEAPDWFAPEDADRMEFERKDLDITAGVMFTPYIGVFVGYKSIDAPMEYTNAASTPTFSSADFGSMTIKGPGFGILGNIPLGQSAALYGNLALLSVEQQFEYPVRTFVSSLGNTRGSTGTTPAFDMIGASFELGSAFAFSEIVSANVGFKYQSFWGDDAYDNTDTQSFYGLTVGLNFTF